MVEITIENINTVRRHLRTSTLPEHDKYAATVFSKSVSDRDPNIVEGDISRTRCTRIACLDGLRFNARTAFDKDDSKAVFCSAANSEIIGEAGKVVINMPQISDRDYIRAVLRSIRDPFLAA